MPWIHPRTWEDGVMPLAEFPQWKQDEIAAAVEAALENLQTLCRPCNSRKGARV